MKRKKVYKHGNTKTEGQNHSTESSYTCKKLRKEMHLCDYNDLYHAN